MTYSDVSTPALLLSAITVFTFMPRHATAQAPIIMPAATQPSADRFVLRNQLRYLEARDHPATGMDDFREITFWNNLDYGLTGNLAINLSIPVKYREYARPDGTSRETWGIADPELQAKWRVYQKDFGPIDTARLSLLGGVQIRGGDSNFTTDGFNPSFGAVYTHVQGRHGFNVAARYKINTGRGSETNLGGGDGRDDALFYDASYLYRLSPAQYDAKSTGALYAVLEMNGVYETNGDNELFLSPGLMYEARTWTLEAAIRLPVWQEIDHRPETRFVTYVGLRLLF